MCSWPSRSGSPPPGSGTPRCGCAAGDATALDDYDQHGRIHGAPPDEAMDQAVKAYVASYLAAMTCCCRPRTGRGAGNCPRRIRDDLIHLGLVDAARAVQIAEGAQASVGDLIICRENDHDIEAGEPGRALANGDILRIEAITADGIMVRRMLDPDPATGQRRFTSHAFCLLRLPHSWTWPTRSPATPRKAAPCTPGSRWSPAAKTGNGCTRR